MAINGALRFALFLRGKQHCPRYAYLRMDVLKKLWESEGWCSPEVGETWNEAATCLNDHGSPCSKDECVCTWTSVLERAECPQAAGIFMAISCKTVVILHVYDTSGLGSAKEAQSFDKLQKLLNKALPEWTVAVRGLDISPGLPPVSGAEWCRGTECSNQDCLHHLEEILLKTRNLSGEAKLTVNHLREHMQEALVTGGCGKIDYAACKRVQDCQICRKAAKLGGPAAAKRYFECPNKSAEQCPDCAPGSDCFTSTIAVINSAIKKLSRVRGWGRGCRGRSGEERYNQENERERREGQGVDGTWR